MRVDNLIDHLKMFPDDMDVYIQTTPEDLCSPITRKHFSVIKASHDERYGIENAKLCLTAYHAVKS